MANRKSKPRLAVDAPAKPDVAHSISLSGEQDFDGSMAFSAIESNCAAIANILEVHIGMTYPCTNEGGIEIRFSVLALNAAVLAAEARLYDLVYPDADGEAAAAEVRHG